MNPKKVDEEMKEKIKGEAHIGISVTFCTSNYIQGGDCKSHHNMAEILPIRRKTLSNQSINQSRDCKTHALDISALVFFLEYYQEGDIFFALHTHPYYLKIR